MPKKPISNRRLNQRGNAMVEIALTLIPTIAMFFGILDVSLVVYLQSTLNHAMREGARLAVTFPIVLWRHLLCVFTGDLHHLGSADQCHRLLKRIEIQSRHGELLHRQRSDESGHEL